MAKRGAKKTKELEAPAYPIVCEHGIYRGREHICGAAPMARVSVFSRDAMPGLILCETHLKQLRKEQKAKTLPHKVFVLETYENAGADA